MVDTGFRADLLLDVASLGRLAGAPAHPIVRLESVAEQVIRSGIDSSGYAQAFRAALAAALSTAVGTKSVVAYRHGLDFDPEPPTDTEVSAAAGAWLRAIAIG